MFPTPPAPGSIIRFDADPRFSHVVVTVTKPGKWFDREETFAFQFLGWATVAHVADGGGWRADIEAMLLIHGQIVPSSAIAATMALEVDQQVVMTQIVPVGVTEEQ